VNDVEERRGKIKWNDARQGRRRANDAEIVKEGKERKKMKKNGKP
jgi:hypothetical protein